MQRRARKADSRSKPALGGHKIQETIGLAVRIHEGRHSAPEIKTALRSLGLNKKYDAVFVKLDESGLPNSSPWMHTSLMAM